MLAELPPPPGDHRLRLHDDQGVPPSESMSRDPYPKEAIGGGESRSLATSLEHGELMPKGEDLYLHRGVGLEEGGEE